MWDSEIRRLDLASCTIRHHFRILDLTHTHTDTGSSSHSVERENI